MAYRVSGVIDGQSDILMELLAKAGIACGSQRLTALCVAKIRKTCSDHPHDYAGGFGNMCKALRMSEAQFEHAIAYDFESFKTSRWESHRYLNFEWEDATGGVEFTFTITR